MSWSSMSQVQKLEYLVDRCELATNYGINDGSQVHTFEVHDVVWGLMSTSKKLGWYMQWCLRNPNIIEHIITPDVTVWDGGCWVSELEIPLLFIVDTTRSIDVAEAIAKLLGNA